MASCSGDDAGDVPPRSADFPGGSAAGRKAFGMRKLLPKEMLTQMTRLLMESKLLAQAHELSTQCLRLSPQNIGRGFRGASGLSL